MRPIDLSKRLSTFLCLLVFLGGCAFSPRIKYERIVDLQRPMASGATLGVNTSSGSITVRGAETSRCEVHAKIRVGAMSEAQAREIAEQISVRLVETDRGIDIEVERPKLRNVSISISYEISVPHATSVVCHASSGSVRLYDLEGRFDASASSGSVHAEDLSGAEAKLHSSSGSVRLTRARVDACDLYTSSGSVRADQITCPAIKARASSGSVTVVCTADTPPNLVADCSSSSGSVTLTVPSNYSGRVNMSTSSGSASSDFPIALEGKKSRKRLAGTIGEGSGRITLKTSSGSVRLRH